jgi:hypothetical protein
MPRHRRARRGREIASFLPDDPNGFKPDAARTWGGDAVQGADLDRGQQLGAVLMITGGHDAIEPLESARLPLFRRRR